ncbi:MAG: hypothetical protein EAZ27_11125 [Cytophagales bacterium]|nr:MAG: hypothetical protein EAZ27_11125 [Cytophagales bacterium]
METLIIEVKTKKEALDLKNLLIESNAKVELYNDYVERKYANWIAEGHKNDILTEAEKSDFLKSLGK